MDLVGPLTETPRGIKYIITLTDYYTKWAEAAPLKDKGAISVAQFLDDVRSFVVNNTMINMNASYVCGVYTTSVCIMYNVIYLFAFR